MTFDLRTIYAMTAVACMVLGLLQGAAYFTGRFERWLVWWSASNILVGIGSFCIALRGMAPDFITVHLGNVMTIAGCVLLAAAMRIFVGRTVNLSRCCLLIAILSMPLVFVFDAPGESLERLAYGSAIYCLLDLAVAREAYRLARDEKLHSAKLAVGLFVLTAAVFASRSVMAGTGILGDGNLFSSSNAVHAWMALSAMVFLMLRSMVIMLMAAERTGAQLKAAAHCDPLTGVLNRSGLVRSFASLPSKPVAALVVDIDYFKQLNDTHGHAMGDEVLRAFASSAAREIHAGDLIARYGGDEFVIVLKERSLEQAVEAAEHIRLAFTASLGRLNQPLSVLPTLSIGAAAEASGAADLEALLHKADQALYARKRQGRNGVDAFRDNILAA
ncbi:GGDEF domain-containing protein [Neorhizobium sp. CSC1952]|uniref:GGDEF domain-containing protein n=1 Tax=Neorhizobium sp. CSC1952 TaxID=2978974 RepID=UPI0025A4F433|nr:GGDEF domain-containing protein [Rhizobium sp. CSC1952]WJR65516.1 GGDEF domain-containing protein [Rhizobium sp. CSC1952]